MKTFIQYLEEAAGKGLTIFDIDDTLFHTTAKVHVKKDDKVIHALTNQEFNTYKLKDGEEFDFGEFKSAKLFKQTSTPIGKMIAKAKAILKRAVPKGSKVIMATARSDFDDRDTFLDTFRAHGIDIDKIHVERAGNLNLGSPAKNKKYIFQKYLKTGLYKRARLFDDSKQNLNSFMSLSKKYPDVTFDAYLVKDTGNISTFK
jgi:hypothetical protein